MVLAWTTANVSSGMNRPTSAGVNHRSDSHTAYRKSSTMRPTNPRHATSSQYILPTTPSSPTRIYGTRYANHSAENLPTNNQANATPLPTKLPRSQTAPDMQSNMDSPGRKQDNRPPSANRSLAKVTPERVQYQSSSVLSPPPSVQVSLSQSEDSSNRKPVTSVERTKSGSKVILDDVGIKPVLPIHDSLIGESYAGGTIPRTAQHQTDIRATSIAVSKIAGHNQLRALSDEAGQNTSTASRKPLPAAHLDSASNGTNFEPSVSESNLEKITEGSILDSISNTRESVSAGRPRAQTPVPSNYMSQERSKSLKSRLRRALSFGSSSSLSELADGAPRRASQKGRSSSALYGHGNQSMDDVSVSSTASSASVMLRKMTQGLSRKTKRSLGGIFSGSKSKAQDLQPNVPIRTVTTPTVGSINYVNAEVDAADRPQSPRRDIFPNHTRGSSSISSAQIDATSPKIEVTKAVDNIDGHGSVAFPRLSQEITVEDDRHRRASMHLERPLPIDLAEATPARVPVHRFSPLNRKSPTVAASPSTENPSSSGMASAEVGNKVGLGKGILKKTLDPLSAPQVPKVAHNALPPMSPAESPKSMHDFDFSFDPAPVLQDFTVVDSDPKSASNDDTAKTTLLSTNESPSNKSSPALQFSPRITIHDTYTATEYDRRGELATCNRLTPLLAQRIKEELNAYKMDEMSVAEESKMYTHFFA